MKTRTAVSIHCPDQRGSALIAVMVVMALLMILASSLVNHFSVAESEAVEQTLADSRVFWAEMGHVNYMLSRARFGGLCTSTEKLGTSSLNAASACLPSNGDDDGNNGAYPSFSGRLAKTRVGSMQDYLGNTTAGAGAGELQRPESSSVPGSRRWFYPRPTDTGAQSYFNIQGFVSGRKSDDNTRLNSGLMQVDLEVVETGTVPVFQGTPDRTGRLRVGFCVTDQADSTISLNIGQCPVSVDMEGASIIQFIQRLPLLYDIPTP
jgi:hypothetical protein